MRRRDLVTGLGAATVAWPLLAYGEALRVVALVLPVLPTAQMIGDDPASPPARAFVRALRELGWVEGRNVMIERRSAEGQPERASAIFAELKDRGVDVVALGGAPWLVEAARRTMPMTPVVALFAEDPVAGGYVASLTQPGANLTGVSTTTGPEIFGKRLELLKELVPDISRVVFLGSQAGWDTYRAAAEAAELIFVPLHPSEQLEAVLASVLRERAEALLVQGGPIAYVNARRIAEFAAENQLPSMFPFREAVEAGGLICYGPSVEGLFAQLAGFVDRILRGSKPADMPVEQPTQFELVVNIKTAQALGLAIPQSIMLRADEVIE